jgi:plastocyanin
LAGGVPASVGLTAAATSRRTAPFSVVQISDSHIGFSKPFNPDARVTFREAVAKIAALPRRPDFIARRPAARAAGRARDRRLGARPPARRHRANPRLTDPARRNLGMPRLRPAALAGAVILAFGAVSAAVAAASASASAVTIDNFAFSAGDITVAACATVTWTNDDDTPHTVRAVDGSFHSRAMDTADSYSFTFSKPGVYSYFCTLHPKMVGKVIVK